MKDGLRSSAARILVVDDHPLSRRFIVSALRQNGACVKQVGSASAALVVAQEWRPEVILMDFRLGNADGSEIARRIRTGWPPALGQPRIVMLTAETLDDHRIKALRAYVDDVLPKPVEPALLLRAVSGEPLNAQHAVSEQVSLQLQSLFRSELSVCLERLDGFVASRDLVSARAVLHQLIASSGMCGQHRLNRHLRALHDRCGREGKTGELARAHFAVLVSARAFLRPQNGVIRK